MGREGLWGRTARLRRIVAGTATAVLLLPRLAVAAAGQPPASAAPPADPFQILDNSFLVEEAFNQEKAIFQNIFGATRQNGDWQLTFTQEWPAPAQRHQLSYTLSAESAASQVGFGDMYLNYRFQAMEEGPGRPAFAPRLSVIVPSGRRAAGGGEGGIQVNLAFSKQRRDMYFHWNGGVTWLPRGEAVDLVSPWLAGSAIYRLRPMLNLMLESVLAFDAAEVSAGRAERMSSFTISPGLRGGWNLGPRTQLILGAAVPITRVDGSASAGVFGYCSYELPFAK